MSAKTIWFLLAAAILLLGMGAGSVYWAFSQVPEFYTEAIQKPVDPVVRKEAAQQFESRTLQLVANIREADAWAETFTQEQVNSWLAEELQSEKFRKAVPPGVQDPRIKLSQDTIQVGFRFDRGEFHGIVSLELKPWIVEPNRLAVEIRQIKAGLVPIPLDTVLKELTGQIETHGWNVDWKQSDGNEVVIVNLDNGEERAPVLEQVAVLDGELSVSGSRRGSASPSEAAAASSSTSEDSPPSPPRVAAQSARGAN